MTIPDDRPVPKRRFDWTWEETILALDLYLSSGSGAFSPMSLGVRMLSELLRGSAFREVEGRKDNFRNPDSIAMKALNLRSLDPKDSPKGLVAASDMDRYVWSQFGGGARRVAAAAAAIRRRVAGDELGATVLDEDADVLVAWEGQVHLRQHFERERDRRIVGAKKRAVLATTGHLACEVCGFDFALAYGDRGRGFIECHHRIPIASIEGKHEVTQDDLALVCANCHRMLHRGPEVLLIEQLRVNLASRTTQGDG